MLSMKPLIPPYLVLQQAPLCQWSSLELELLILGKRAGMALKQLTVCWVPSFSIPGYPWWCLDKSSSSTVPQ